jgi:hypothetical protein
MIFIYLVNLDWRIQPAHRYNPKNNAFSFWPMLSNKELNSLWLTLGVFVPLPWMFLAKNCAGVDYLVDPKQTVVLMRYHINQQQSPNLLMILLIPLFFSRAAVESEIADAERN